MSRRRAHPALLALAVLVAGQLAALGHAASTRHVVCAEHGEQLDVAPLAEPLHACEQDHVVGVESDHAGGHEDCAIARSLHQRARTSPASGAPALVIHVSHRAARCELAAPRPTSLYSIAPKTSPPIDESMFVS